MTRSSKVDPHIVADVAYARAVEEAYRRGFAQGAELALRQVEEGHAERSLQRWLRDVHAWRSALSQTMTPADRNGWRCPPELPAPLARRAAK